MKSFAGFSLIELLVGMSVIAILSALAVFGVTELQKSSRDSQRVNTLSQMVSILNDYKKDNLNYPPTNLVAFNTSFNIDNISYLALIDFNVAGSTTSANSTKYQYANSSGKFGLCAVLESGKVENVGEIIIDCL